MKKTGKKINIAKLVIAALVCAVVLGGGILALTKWMPLEKTVPVSAEPEQEETVITVGSAGDIILHRPFLYSSAYRSENGYDFSSAFTYIKSIYEKFDLMAVNLETTLSGEEAGYSGYPMFKSPYTTGAHRDF